MPGSFQDLRDAERWAKNYCIAGWKAYTPSWTCVTGDAPAIGNGTLTGYYMAQAGMCLAVVNLTAGSTTTFGSGGAWEITLPIPCLEGVAVVGLAKFVEASAGGTCVLGVVQLSSGTAVDIDVEAGSVSNAVPFAWTTSDAMFFSIIYPVRS